MTAESTAGTGAVEPRPAATVVLLRPGRDGLEVLLTHRPSTMAFAADVHVFPGGRADAADADPRLVARSALTADAAAEALGGDLPPAAALAAYIAAIRECFEETGVLLADHRGGSDLDAARGALLADASLFPELADTLELRLWTDRLVPLSRWVTPPTMPRRFDARFFAAALPDGAEVALVGDEVAAHAWHRPRAALDEMADGRLPMWIPTSATLQQLEHVSSVDEIAERLAPGRLGDIAVETIDENVTRITMPAGGGVAGQPVCAYLAGERRCVLIDPGDPTGPGLDAAIELAAARGGSIAAVALTHIDPDHAAGSEALAERLDIPVLASPRRAADLPYAVTPLFDGDVVKAGDLPLRVVETPGPTPDHLAFVLDLDGDVETPPIAIVGDLEGPRGARSVPGPTDPEAWATSRARLRALEPDARWLTGHPDG